LLQPTTTNNNQQQPTTTNNYLALLAMQQYFVYVAVALLEVVCVVVFVVGHERDWFDWAVQAPPNLLVACCSSNRSLTLAITRTITMVEALVVLGCAVWLDVASHSLDHSVMLYFSFWNYLLYTVYFVVCVSLSVCVWIGYHRLVGVIECCVYLY
jgi:hypothetical protein